MIRHLWRVSSELESSDPSVDSNADSTRIGMWVRAFIILGLCYGSDHETSPSEHTLFPVSHNPSQFHTGCFTPFLQDFPTHTLVMLLYQGLQDCLFLPDQVCGPGCEEGV